MLGKALGHAQAVILRKPMVSGFNPTLELGAAGYKVVTYCFVFFFFVLGVGWGGVGWGAFWLVQSFMPSLYSICVLFKSTRGGILDLGKVGNNIKYKSLSSQSFF